MGIASVTHVLKDLLNDGLINQNVSAALGTVVNVTSLPPGQVEPQQGSASTQLNIFLYRVSYNTGWNNVGYPSRNSRGEPVSNPPLALNLHYLLTAFGEDELHAEILLGYGMQLLHETPVLDRNAIRDSLAPVNLANPNGRLPSNLTALASSRLAEQIEQIKITPEPLNTEEMSKLWTAFQTKYRLCTAYMATVVLIESDKPARSALPVMKRNVYAVPFRHPVINKILSSENTANALITEFRRIETGNILVLQGEQLKSEGMMVKIGGVPIVPDDANISDTRISIELEESLALQAGIHGVQVVQPSIVVEGKRDIQHWEELNEWTPATNYSIEDVVVIINVVEDYSIAYSCLIAHTSTGDFTNDLDNNNWEVLSKRRRFKGTYSNLQAFVLSPTITSSTVVAASVGGSLFSANVTVEVVPNLQKGQRVMLLLNEINVPPGTEPVSYSFILPPEELTASVNSVTFEIEGGIKGGAYLVQIQVDGAASPLVTNPNGEFTGPSITII